MSCKNLAGNWMGESHRVTLRLTDADIRLLDRLAETWQSDRSEVLRRALREAGVHEHRRHRDALLAELLTMTVPELRALACQHWIRGRSKMTKAQLQEVLRTRLQR
jgi:metal-responsive CopG/Arc/MetJ family transcriptional regulator